MPRTPTTPDGLRAPVDSDSPDIPRDFGNLADDTQDALNRVRSEATTALTNAGIPRFANATARNAAIPPGSAQNGQVTYLIDPGVYQTYGPPGLWVFAYYIGVGNEISTPLTANQVYTPPWALRDAQPVNTTPLPFTTSEITIQRNAVYALDFTVAVNLSVAGHATLSTLVNGGSVANTSQYMVGGFDYTPGKGVTMSLKAGDVVSASVKPTVAANVFITSLRVAQLTL
jgi:hypothetical protein